MSRQNYYARRKERQRREVDGQLVEELVKRERSLHPRMGVRKLHWKLGEELREAGARIGRDRLFEELRGRELLIKRRRRGQPKTTQSYHTLPVFKNLIKGREVSKPNEVWVSDLTYVRTREGYLYLTLITDKSSRKIVGYHAGDTLEAQGSVKALKMALKELPAGSTPIHHSDRGCQFCSHEYVGELERRGLAVSMTEEDHCAENALAERMNGILKQEYGLGQEFMSKKLAHKTILQGVWLYNTQRPHGGLAMEVPDRVHRNGLCKPREANVDAGAN